MYYHWGSAKVRNVLNLCIVVLKCIAVFYINFIYFARNHKTNVPQWASQCVHPFYTFELCWLWCLTSWLLLPVTGQRSEAKVNVTWEGGARTEVAAVRCGRGACPGGRAPHLTAWAPAERNRTIFHWPAHACNNICMNTHILYTYSSSKDDKVKKASLPRMT